MMPWVGAATTGMSVLKIGYHCYQVFLTKKETPGTTGSSAA
jgi:hypothetical protein